MVTFLLLAGMVPGKRNCLQVIDEIQEIRSPSSVSGLRLSFTIRLPEGNFLQELNSFSPITDPPVAVPIAPGGKAAGAGAAAGGSRRRRPGTLTVGAGLPAGTLTAV